jgi:hypothetical protein
LASNGQARVELLSLVTRGEGAIPRLSPFLSGLR